MNEIIQKLREATGAGIMACKKALEEAGSDLEKAKKILEAKGIDSAAKKSERKTGAGLLETYIHQNRIGVLLEVRCETDFVARGEQFKTLAHELAMQIAAMNPESPEELLKQEYIKDPSLKIEDLVKKEIARFGENIKVERFCRHEL